MRWFAVLIRPVLYCIIVMLLGAGFVVAAEIDDSAFFVEAFNAFQKKDYLLAIEKANELNQVFPDSPLRDVTLLLIARSCIKSGDNVLAAKTIIKFKEEFSESGLNYTIEEELLALADKHRKGELLLPDKQRQEAAKKIRDERIALERAAALKLEQDRIAKEKADKERIAREQADSEKRERERLAAERIEKGNIKTTITVREGVAVTAVGQNGSMPVEIISQSSKNEEFLLEVNAAPEYGATLAAAEKPEVAVNRIKLATGGIFKGLVHFRMPGDRVDGHRASITIKTVSSRYSDVIQSKNALIIASAPLVRVVAKLAKPKVSPGEQLPYRVTVLNIGSLPAQDLTVRLQLPPQLDFLGAPNLKFRQEQNGTFVFRVERLETGKMADISLNVKVRENSRAGQELRGHVEVINGHLQRKDIFTANASVVSAKPTPE